MAKRTKKEHKLRVLIVEDDFSFGLELEMMVEKIGYHVIALVDNSAEALEMIYAEEPDFILMDIDIKGRMTGLEIGEKIKALQIPVLYITSFGDDAHYQAAKKSQMVGYLVKPIDKYSLQTSIDLAFRAAFLEGQKAQQIEAEDSFLVNDTFFMKKKESYYRVPMDEILYVQANENYCETYVDADNYYTARMTLSKMEKLLATNRFFRTHRSYIVQLSQVESINFYESTLSIAGKTLPISRSKRKMLELLIKKIE